MSSACPSSRHFNCGAALKLLFHSIIIKVIFLNNCFMILLIPFLTIKKKKLSKFSTKNHTKFSWITLRQRGNVTLSLCNRALFLLASFWSSQQNYPGTRDKKSALRTLRHFVSSLFVPLRAHIFHPNNLVRIFHPFIQAIQLLFNSRLSETRLSDREKFFFGFRKSSQLVLTNQLRLSLIGGRVTAPRHYYTVKLEKLLTYMHVNYRGILEAPKKARNI